MSFKTVRLVMRIGIAERNLRYVSVKYVDIILPECLERSGKIVWRLETAQQFQRLGHTDDYDT